MQTTRRNFIKTAGSLTIGFCLGTPSIDNIFSPFQELPRELRDNPNINAWLEVLANGKIRVLTGKIELGQGIRTAVAQVAAEELDMHMSMVEVVIAETGRTPNEGYTAGSASIENSAMAIRYAAGAARKKLLELASQKLNTTEANLELEKGIVKVKNGNRSISFAQLLDGKQLTDEIRLPVTLKEKDQYRLVGKAVPRDDISRMIRGEQVYVQDLRFPGMVHARVVRPPAYSARLVSFDEAAVKQKFPGLLKIVVNGSFLAVIAADEYVAIQAQQFLREHSKWSDGKSLPHLSGNKLADYLIKLPVQTQRVANKGSVSTMAGSNTFKARYFKPYIMHGAIGPSCSVAVYDNNMLHVYSHSQGVYPLRDSIADLLKIPAANIHVQGVPGSGCYGHNGADDAAADAALLAVAYPGKHIRVQWMREDEHAWEPYGSAMVMEMEALLDGSGKICHWKYALWSDTHGTRPGGNAQNLLQFRYLQNASSSEPSGFSGGAYRNAEPYYAIPNLNVEAHFFKGPLRVSSLRGLGAYANIFAIECFIDELSEKAEKDPFEFRLLHLTDERAKEVVRELQLLTKEQQLPNTGFGIAFSRYKNSATYCGVAARISIDKSNGTIHVQKMWAVIDSGEVINLDGIKNQIEGGMIQSASWTLQEEVHFDDKNITSRHWGTYPIFRYDQVPEVEVVVIPRMNEKPLGAGEASQGPAAAAIVNAVYRASGKRVRTLPVGRIT